MRSGPAGDTALTRAIGQVVEGRYRTCHLLGGVGRVLHLRAAWGMVIILSPARAAMTGGGWHYHASRHYHSGTHGRAAWTCRAQGRYRTCRAQGRYRGYRTCRAQGDTGGPKGDTGDTGPAGPKGERYRGYRTCRAQGRYRGYRTCRAQGRYRGYRDLPGPRAIPGIPVPASWGS